MTFWFVIKDNDSKAFELLCCHGDDSHLTKMVATMQSHGINVNCTAIDAARFDQEGLRADLVRLGFSEQEGLFQTLQIRLDQLEQKKQKE